MKESAPSTDGGREPGRRVLCVPVRTTGGAQSLVLARTAEDGRVAIAFTDPDRLRSAMGAAQPWTAMAEAALRSLVRPLGVLVVHLDAQVVARPPVPAGPRRPGGPVRPMAAAGARTRGGAA
jgi:hypothetical protein